jgi:hypothetical protein
MSQAKSKEELQHLERKTREAQIRQKWCAALRSQRERQCKGWGDGVTACAMHVLWEVAGCPAVGYREIGEHAGLDGTQTWAVIRSNDTGHLSFSQIADRIEGWFKG